MALPRSAGKNGLEDEEDPLTTQPALRDGAQQARLQQRQARWMGAITFVIVLVACLVLQ